VEVDLSFEGLTPHGGRSDRDWAIATLTRAAAARKAFMVESEDMKFRDEGESYAS